MNMGAVPTSRIVRPAGFQLKDVLRPQRSLECASHERASRITENQVLVALSAASVLASFAADRAGTAPTELEMWVEEPMRTRPLPQPVREVIGGILQATDTADAHVLLEQLAVAQESYFEDEHGDFLITVEFEVPGEVTCVVPHFQIYPVHARFRAPEGTELQVGLQLIRGELANVAIEAVDEDHIEPVDEILHQWPQIADLRYVRETTDGHFLPPTLTAFPSGVSL